jgi:histidine triad (HIT) family protein
MPDSCVFCRIVAGEIPAHMVHEDEKTIVFLDNGPLFAGHCLVCPKQHYDTMYDVPKSMLAPLFSTTQLIAQAIEQGLGAEGTFVAINNKVSQSVPHLHVHVIPRRRKDGMKGFFWPRRPYRDTTEAAETAATLRATIEGLRDR